MRKATSIAFTEEMLRAIDQHPLSKDVSRSAVVRIALAQFLEKSERKEKKNETSETK